MASGSWTFSTANKYITGKVEWSSTSNGSQANNSTVKVSLYYKKSTSSTASTRGTFSGTITINGTSYSVSKSLTLSCNNSYVLVGSASAKVAHNSDGSKSTTIAAKGGISGTSFSSSSTSKTVTLDKIPRYATVSFDTKSTTQTSATFQWTADATCNSIQYRLDGGSWITASGSPYPI